VSHLFALLELRPVLDFLSSRERDWIAHNIIPSGGYYGQCLRYASTGKTTFQNLEMRGERREQSVEIEFC